MPTSYQPATRKVPNRNGNKPKSTLGRHVGQYVPPKGSPVSHEHPPLTPFPDIDNAIAWGYVLGEEQ